jgi:hypothetical protein
VGEFFGMESVLQVCENSRENSPEEILQQLTGGGGQLLVRPAATGSSNCGDLAVHVAR